jgi:glycosyltransferase involved in cell wall biosynthesis
MHILYLLIDPTQAADHRRGGYATHVREVVAALEAAGHTVEILDSRVASESAGAPAPVAGARPADGPAERGRATGRARRLAGLPPGVRAAGRDLIYLVHNRRGAELVNARLRRGGVDLVYERFHHLQWAGMTAARRHRVPAILEFNAGVGESAAFHGAGLTALARWIEARTLLAAGRVITVSGVLRREVMALGVPAERVTAMHNGVDTERFHPGIDGQRARAELGIGLEEVVIGFVGTFAPWHGVEFLISAALELVAAGEPGRFLVVGGRSDEVRFQSVREQVAAAGAEGRILLTGEVPFARVPSLMAAMDVATVPWATDYGSPMKLFEYMAMGRALVVPDLPVLREVFEDGVNALLVRRGDPRALAGAIRRLVEDPALRGRLGAAARRAAVDRHDWRHHARLIERLAEELGAGGRGVPVLERGESGR